MFSQNAHLVHSTIEPSVFRMTKILAIQIGLTEK